LREALSHTYVTGKLQYSVTLAAHFGSYEAARDKLKHWYAVLDRRRLGKHWCKQPKSIRTQFVGVAEREGGWHFHLNVIVPETRWVYDIAAEIHKAWLTANRGNRCATCVCDPVTSQAEHERTANYMTKRCWQEKIYDGVIFSDDFLHS